ncbi:NTP transferase domain-containing protein [Lacibacterium aquatile]|uniref:NTP transferase domain-containing protein n=1 Tax=Lacibacterium aquatile TaxID=1168082 RepID=A0ABW5DNL6_9PROT
MKFGPLSVDQAVDALLAHSIKAEGLVFKKGRKLSAEDVGRLAAAGITTIIAARLDAGDMHEDEVADRLAALLAGTGLRAGQAFTGRANLFAEASGIVTLDADRIEALNGIDEAITLATLPPFAQVQAGDMVATLKVIPFAAPRTAVETAEEIIGALPLLSLTAFRPMAALLIQTQLPVLKASVLDGTARVTSERLTALGSALIGEMRTPHNADALATAIAACPADVDLLLIAGASAIVDRADVIPAAIEAAGGTVTRFGLPVDPGNLLLLGTLADGRPVVGLPGCARSPKLNGLDWILQRLAAALPIDAPAIRKMAIGGLLSEIGTRPQPRGGRDVPRAPKISGLLLAAGRSSRMGRNKLLMPVDGRPMVRKVAETLLAARSLQDLTVVLGHETALVRQALDGLPVQFVETDRYQEGLSGSLKAGLESLPQDIDGLLVALGDMPLVDSLTIDRLAAAFNPTEGRAICQPVHGGQRGNPVLWDSRFIVEMQEVTGDTGARALLQRHAGEICEVACPSPGVLIDLDTPEAFAANIV